VSIAHKHGMVHNPISATGNVEIAGMKQPTEMKTRPTSYSPSLAAALSVNNPPSWM
jgi:hypothetical protein